MQKIPYGYCQCGCGQTVRLNRGEPRKYVTNHHRRKCPTEYTTDDNGCWVWQRATSAGYGQIRVDGRLVGAHRHYYMEHVGSIPKGMFVLHKCDNRKCVNPAHLFLGTHDDNMEDMRKKNRQPNNKGTTRAKFTKDDVLNIRQQYASGVITQQELANKYGSSIEGIAGIIRRVRWSNV